MFKVKNKDVALLSLLTLNIFHTLFCAPIANFVQEIS